MTSRIKPFWLNSYMFSDSSANQFDVVSCSIFICRHNLVPVWWPALWLEVWFLDVRWSHARPTDGGPARRGHNSIHQKWGMGVNRYRWQHRFTSLSIVSSMFLFNSAWHCPWIFDFDSLPLKGVLVFALTR